MVDRTSQEKSNHEQLIKAMIRHLEEKEKFNSIRADLPGSQFPMPEIIEGHIPDIVALKISETCIVEAETCDTISHPHTEEQWRAFAKAASRPNTSFRIIVPNACEQKARERVGELGITASIWTLEL